MDKSTLTTDRVKDTTDEVEIPGVGTVTVRGMTRHEYIEASKLVEKPWQQERYILACCMVDPQMNEDDVAAWQKASPPDEINQVANKVNELSGIRKGADKSRVAEVRD